MQPQQSCVAALAGQARRKTAHGIASTALAQTRSDSSSRRVEDKATWSRGLIISQNGFTADALHAFGRGKSVVCMDGLDLHEVLSEPLDLAEVIALKVRHVAETGAAFVAVRNLRGLARG